MVDFERWVHFERNKVEKFELWITIQSINLFIMQAMIVFPYKLDAPTYWYTMSIVDLVMESVLEVLEKRTPKHVSQMSPSVTLLSTTPWPVWE